VLEELKRHAGGGGKKGRAARLALRVVEEKCLMLKDGLPYRRADDELVELSLRYGVPVATADLKLRKRLLRRSPTFYYRESQRRIMSDDYWM
jgi:rRNA-processing protein FCF1